MVDKYGYPIDTRVNSSSKHSRTSRSSHHHNHNRSSGNPQSPLSKSNSKLNTNTSLREPLKVQYKKLRTFRFRIIVSFTIIVLLIILSTLIFHFTAVSQNSSLVNNDIKSSGESVKNGESNSLDDELEIIEGGTSLPSNVMANEGEEKDGNRKRQKKISLKQFFTGINANAEVKVDSEVDKKDEESREKFNKEEVEKHKEETKKLEIQHESKIPQLNMETVKKNELQKKKNRKDTAETDVHSLTHSEVSFKARLKEELVSSSDKTLNGRRGDSSDNGGVHLEDELNENVHCMLFEVEEKSVLGRDGIWSLENGCYSPSRMRFILSNEDYQRLPASIKVSRWKNERARSLQRRSELLKQPLAELEVLESSAVSSLSPKQVKEWINGTSLLCRGQCTLTDEDDNEGVTRLALMSLLLYSKYFEKQLIDTVVIEGALSNVYEENPIEMQMNRVVLNSIANVTMSLMEITKREGGNKVRSGPKDQTLEEVSDLICFEKLIAFDVNHESNPMALDFHGQTHENSEKAKRDYHDLVRVISGKERVRELVLGRRKYQESPRECGDQHANRNEVYIASDRIENVEEVISMMDEIMETHEMHGLGVQVKAIKAPSDACDVADPCSRGYFPDCEAYESMDDESRRLVGRCKADLVSDALVFSSSTVLITAYNRELMNTALMFMPKGAHILSLLPFGVEGDAGFGILAENTGLVAMHYRETENARPYVKQWSSSGWGHGDVNSMLKVCANDKRCQSASRTLPIHVSIDSLRPIMTSFMKSWMHRCRSIAAQSDA